MKIDRIKNENNCFREKIENTNGGISSYISEMSTLLDSSELSSLFNDTASMNQLFSSMGNGIAGGPGAALNNNNQNEL